ncbi:hypothetical protein SK128_016255, partial [Halocaridina rubra]
AVPSPLAWLMVVLETPVELEELRLSEEAMGEEALEAEVEETVAVLPPVRTSLVDAKDSSKTRTAKKHELLWVDTTVGGWGLTLADEYPLY